MPGSGVPPLGAFGNWGSQNPSDESSRLDNTLTSAWQPSVSGAPSWQPSPALPEPQQWLGGGSVSLGQTITRSSSGPPPGLNFYPLAGQGYNRDLSVQQQHGLQQSNLPSNRQFNQSINDIENRDRGSSLNSTSSLSSQPHQSPQDMQQQISPEMNADYMRFMEEQKRRWFQMQQQQSQQQQPRQQQPQQQHRTDSPEKSSQDASSSSPQGPVPPYCE